MMKIKWMHDKIRGYKVRNEQIYEMIEMHKLKIKGSKLVAMIGHAYG